MIQAKGPVWHRKQKEKNIIPKGLTGLDKEATWSFSEADRWIYGHGSFSLVSHRVPVLGCFIWMPNSSNEAKRLWVESGRYTNRLDTVVMDSKADRPCAVSRIPQTAGHDVTNALPQEHEQDPRAQAHDRGHEKTQTPETSQRTKIYSRADARLSQRYF